MKVRLREWDFHSCFMNTYIYTQRYVYGHTHVSYMGTVLMLMDSKMVLGKNLPNSEGDAQRDTGSIPGREDFLE